MRELDADRRGEPITHGTEAAGRHPAVWLLEAVELRRPHLVLPDFGRDVGVAVLRQLVKAPDSVLRLDHLIRILEGEGFARAPFVDLLPPGLERRLIDLHRSGAPQPHHVFEHVRAIADDGNVDLDVLVDG